MKKIFTFVAAAATALAAMATDYTGQLVVTVNGVESKQQTTITLDSTATGYNFNLKNFVLVAGTSQMPVGNITLNNLKDTTSYGFPQIKVNQKVLIQKGDLAGVTNWIGPMLGPVPIVLDARFSGEVLTVNIDINMQSTLGQTIEVGFMGTGGNRYDVNRDNQVNTGDVSDMVDYITKN